MCIHAILTYAHTFDQLLEPRICMVVLSICVLVVSICELVRSICMLVLSICILIPLPCTMANQVAGVATTLSPTCFQFMIHTLRVVGAGLACERTTL